MARDRFTERVQLRKRRKRVWIAAVVGTLCVAGGLAWAAWSTSWLAVKQVRIVGLEYTSEAQVLDTAQVPIGTPLLQVSTGEIEDRIGEIRMVRQATVQREFPDTIRVTIVERQPVAWVEQGGAPWAVDASGVVFRKLTAKPKGLARLNVSARETKTLEAAAQVADELASVDPEFFARVGSISAKSQDSIELTFDGNKTVVWGDSENTQQKVQTLDALLKVPARRYDVSAPERPTTRK